MWVEQLDRNSGEKRYLGLQSLQLKKVAQRTCKDDDERERKELEKGGREIRERGVPNA